MGLRILGRFSPGAAHVDHAMGHHKNVSAWRLQGTGAEWEPSAYCPPTVSRRVFKGWDKGNGWRGPATDNKRVYIHLSLGDNMTNFAALIAGLVLMFACANEPTLWQTCLTLYGLLLFATALILILTDVQGAFNALRRK